MTKREDQMRERIYSLEGQLVKAAIMITEARERAEAAEKENNEFRRALDSGATMETISAEARSEINHWRGRAEAAEKRVKEFEEERAKGRKLRRRIVKLPPFVIEDDDALEAKP